MALMPGKTLTEVAADFGLGLPTVRTQLSSILKKVGAKRQSDLDPHPLKRRDRVSVAGRRMA